MFVAVALFAQHRLVTVSSDVDGRGTAFETDVFFLQISLSFIQCFVSEAAALPQWMRLVMQWALFVRVIISPGCCRAVTVAAIR